MWKFIKGVLSETDGTPSSRRLVMFILTALFCGVSLYNLVTGKNLDETLKNQLFYLLIWIFSVVFGDKVVSALKSNTPPPGGDRPKDPPVNP